MHTLYLKSVPEGYSKHKEDINYGGRHVEGAITDQEEESTIEEKGEIREIRGLIRIDNTRHSQADGKAESKPTQGA